MHTLFVFLVKASIYVTAIFLGSEVIAIMTTPKFLLLLFVLLLSLTVSYRIILANKKLNDFLLFDVIFLLFFSLPL